MGQKGSKPKGRNPKSPGTPGTSPLNNATYWEAEEDPDWDSCVMVVATQKGRGYPTLRSSCSNDSLAKSLAKEVDYSPVNVSRRSPDFSIINSPMAPLAPDSRYPTPGQRKRQNTLVDTGWHACFKNNNYVFIRNEGLAVNGSDRQYGDKWKENESDVTFVITTSKPVDSGKEEKLIVSLSDPKPKLTRYSPPPVCEDTPREKGQNPRELSSSGSRKSVNRKKSTNWLKKLRTPGKNRSLKDGAEEEATLITGSAADGSPESLDLAPKIIAIENSLYQPAGNTISSPPTIGLPNQNSPVKDMTPVLGSREDLLDHGPQTSTPKGKNGTDLQVLRRNGTPYRPLDTRLSVRRRLPIDEMTPGSEPSAKTPILSPQQKVLLNAFSEDSHQTSPKLDMPLSPIKKVNNTPCSGSKRSPSEVSLQRRASCFHPTQTSEDEKTRSSASLQRSSSTVLSDYLSKAMEESIESEILKNSIEKLGGGNSDSKTPENRLHPSNSNTDIPFVDSEEDVSFDDRRTRRILKQREAAQAKPAVDASSPRKETVIKSETGSLPLLKTPHSAMTPEKKTISTSEPAISLNETCTFDTVPMSPMEEEENISLNQQTEKILFSPDDSTVTFSPITPAKPSTLDSPISCWLREIRLLTDNECLNALQAKELLKEDWIPNALAVGNAQETSEKIWEIGNTVKEHVEEMLEILKSDKPTSIPLSLKVAQFCSSIIELLKMTSTIKQVSQAEAKIRQACSELLINVNKGDNGNRKIWKEKIKAELEGLQKVSQAIVQQMLLKELHVIVNCVERAENINNLKRSVFAIILLGRLNSTFCEIMTKLGAVRSLLSICVEKKWREMHPCVLRGLTVLSSVPSAIRNFEDSGGVDIVCDVLCDGGVLEGARSEAAGLVAQITAPWTEGSGYVLRSVTANSDRLVKALAGLATKTENSEVFLLSSAALANLSFADLALQKMKEHNVLDILVTDCQNKSHAASLFIKDQVATVLANMAAKEEFRTELSRPEGSLALLLGLLQLRPTGRAEPQLAACERSQQKAAIALARLCSDPHTSNVVAEMQGIQRLVKLCKDRRERNDSDSVLVACLAALRKIAAVRQKEEFAKLGAQELVEPRLWDAFLAHSSKGESYV